jgi:hypothetical protein
MHMKKNYNSLEGYFYNITKEKRKKVQSSNFFYTSFLTVNVISLIIKIQKLRVFFMHALRKETFCKTKKLVSRVAPECHATESSWQLEIPLKAWFAACQVAGIKIFSLTGGNVRGRQAVRQHSGWQLPAGT